jgi:imidazolonepropionase-like amidohydrolase
MTYKVLRAKKLVDGINSNPIDDPIVVVKDDTIVQVGREEEVDIPTNNFEEYYFEDCTLLPGLIDAHIHLTLGTYGGYEKVIRESDSIHLMTGICNSNAALKAGITTLLDAGARNRVSHDLREGSKMGLIQSSRLLICGRPLTITGGHFHFCYDNETNGVEQVRSRIRQFVKEGVDMIKIMASGGGSANIGSLGGPTASQVAYNEEELREAVLEAHKFGRMTTAHCEAYDSIGNAARAGVDTLAHCGFILEDGTRSFDNEAVRTMVDKKLFYNPTLQTGSKRYDFLKDKIEKGDKLTDSEKHSLEGLEYKYSRKFENLKKISEMGVKIVAGSDATGLGNSTRLFRSLELMVDAGMSPMDVIISATGNAAKSINMHKDIGSLQEGKKGDIIAIEGDPLENISYLRKNKMCMINGKII